MAQRVEKVDTLARNACISCRWVLRTRQGSKLILEFKYLQGKYNCMGMGAVAIAEELLLRRFIADRCLQQANNFKIPTLVKALEDCAKRDTDFKSGKITDKLGVEVIILKYSR